MYDYISDRIPRELIKPEKHWYFSTEHITNVVDVSYRMRRALYPLNISKLICWNWGHDGHERNGSSRSRAGIPACNSCYGIPVWFTHYCVSCGGVFVEDFADARFCRLYPHCWDCLPKLSWASCPDHGSNVLCGTSWEPKGLNPRKYTEQEIADAFAFLDG